MARPKSLSTNSTIMLLLTFAALCSASGIDLDATDARGFSTVPSLEFYSFEQFYTANGVSSTNIISSPPNGDELNMQWGNLAVSEQPIRATNSTSAPITGNSPSLIFKNQREDSFSVLKLITLDTDQYKGTLFSICDFTSLNDFTTEAEFTVSGGTGSFRGASGYIISTAVDIGPDHKVYKNLVYLSTCASQPLMFT